MTKANYIQWLETQIVKAEELGGMDLEIWAFRQCLKKARQLEQNEQLFDFLEYCDNAGWIKNVDKKRIIEDYEKANNCA